MFKNNIYIRQGAYYIKNLLDNITQLNGLSPSTVLPTETIKNILYAAYRLHELFVMYHVEHSGSSERDVITDKTLAYLQSSFEQYVYNASNKFNVSFSRLSMVQEVAYKNLFENEKFIFVLSACQYLKYEIMGSSNLQKKFSLYSDESQRDFYQKVNAIYQILFTLKEAVFENCVKTLASFGMSRVFSERVMNGARKTKRSLSMHSLTTPVQILDTDDFTKQYNKILEDLSQITQQQEEKIVDKWEGKLKKSQAILEKTLSKLRLPNNFLTEAQNLIVVGNIVNSISLNLNAAQLAVFNEFLEKLVWLAKSTVFPNNIKEDIYRKFLLAMANLYLAFKNFPMYKSEEKSFEEFVLLLVHHQHYSLQKIESIKENLWKFFLHSSAARNLNLVFNSMQNKVFKTQEKKVVLKDILWKSFSDMQQLVKSWPSVFSKIKQSPVQLMLDTQGLQLVSIQAESFDLELLIELVISDILGNSQIQNSIHSSATIEGLYLEFVELHPQRKSV